MDFYARLKATFSLARYSLSMVPKRKALDLASLHLNSMQQVHNRNVDTLHEASAAAAEVEKALAVAKNEKNAAITAIAFARLDMLRAREIQVRRCYVWASARYHWSQVTPAWMFSVVCSVHCLRC